jgi:alkylhydroperoxidase/carboxymuconolactone decarboxylase family protein YurZ
MLSMEVPVASKPEKKVSKKLPKTYRRFVDRFPGIAEAHHQMNQAAGAAGPLDAKTCELIKMGIALGAGLESSFRSHVRRALERGATPEEVDQAVVLAASTCGFSRAVAGWRWAQECY